ncbi:MAG: FHA domain-containing protein [Flavobacteriia bacterium]|nr:FHA domain-containing protein [Flavobacteriia bacterium]NBX38495.1 FHA domain-containing protein [Flavobacteriia bacterium]
MSQRVHIRVGSNASNQVVINHPAIAEVHLELFADNEGHVFITDLGSPQGTSVNGVRLKGYTLLKDGDEVILGGKIRLNWEKYRVKPRINVEPTPKKVPPVPQPPQEPKKNTRQNPQEVPKKENEREAKMQVSNISLILIFGGIFFLLLLMYLIN